MGLHEEFMNKILYQESHFFISGWRFNFGIRCLLPSSPSPPPSPSPSSNLPPPPPPSPNLFFGVLGGVVLLFQPLLVPGLVSSEHSSPIDVVGRLFEVGGIFAFFRAEPQVVKSYFSLSSELRLKLSSRTGTQFAIPCFYTDWHQRQVQNGPEPGWGVNTLTSICAGTLCGYSG